MPLSDPQLVQRVIDAAAQPVGPEHVEDLVGEPAWINTRRPEDRLALQIADIAADDPERPLPPLRHARDVVYWGRPLAGANPRIVGIVWQGDGPGDVFFGVLYPP